MSGQLTPKAGTISYEAIQSFCARVINLCFEVESANGLSHIQSLREIATVLRTEAEGIQDIYGGRPHTRKGRHK